MFPKKTIVAGPVYLKIISKNSMPFADSPAGQPQFERLPDQEGVALDIGGRAVMTGLALYRLGVPIHLIGKVGEDHFGEVLFDKLREVDPQLPLGLAIDPAVQTGVIQSVPTEKEKIIPGANKTFYASDIPRADLQGVELFHFTDPAAMRSVHRGEGGELVSIFQRARREGLSTSLAFSLPGQTGDLDAADWPLVMSNCLREVDLFFIDVLDLIYIFKRELHNRFVNQPSEHLLEILTPELLHDLSGQVLANRVKAVLIQLGSNGLYLRTAPEKAWKKAGRALAGSGEAWHNQELWAPVFEGNVSDQEAIVSGFLGSLLREEEPGPALLTASVKGKTWEDIQDQLGTGLATAPLEVIGEGWRKEGPHGVWRKA